MNILDLSTICIESMQKMLDNDCNFTDSVVVFCDGKHYYDGVNIQLRTTINHDNYLLVFTVKN